MSMEPIDEAKLHELIEKSYAEVKKHIGLLRGQIAAQHGRSMPRILEQIIPTNAQVLVNTIEGCKSAESEDLLYLIRDVYTDTLEILPKVSSFFSKSSFFFPTKPLKAFERFNRRLIGYVKEVYILCTDCEGVFFDANSMIDDPEALGFWNTYVGQDKYIAEYPNFKDWFYEATQFEIKENPGTKNCPLITAAMFGNLTFGGYATFIKRLSYDNLFAFTGFPTGDVNSDDATDDANADANSQDAKKEKDSRYFYIKSGLISDSKAELCLTIKDPKPGSTVGISEFTGSFEQQWKFDGKGCLVNRATGLALDIARRTPAEQSPIVLWPADGSATQIFIIGMDGRIRPGSEGDGDLCLDVDNGNTGPDSVVILYGTKEGGRNQMWTICPYVVSKRTKK